MYHIILIDEASMENKQDLPNTQEMKLEQERKCGESNRNFFKATARFLQKTIEESNGNRIFISKN